MLLPASMTVKDIVLDRRNQLIGFLAAVLGVKSAVLAQLHGHPLLHPEAGLDTTAYAHLAQQVVAGDLALGPGLYFVSPLYIYVLAAGLAAFDSFTAIRMGQILLGTLSVVFIYITTRDWFDERAAAVAAAFAALTGLFTFYEILILQSAIDAFLTSAALLALTFGLRRRERWFVVAGVVFGVASLNRPNMLIAAVGVAAALIFIRRPRPAFLLAAGLAAGLAPVAIRNAVVARQLTAVSSHGGLNFYIGSGEGATGFYHNVPGISPTIGGQQHDARRVAETATGRSLTDAEVSDYFYERAWTWMRDHPARAVGLFLKKLGYVFSAQHIALPHSYPFYAYDERSLLRLLFVGPWLLVPLGLTGLVLAAPAKRRSEYLAWVAFVPAYAVSVAAFFVAERYRLPLLVPLCVGAGAAIDRIITSGRRPRLSALAKPPRRGDVGLNGAGRRTNELRAMVLTLALLAVLVNWPVKLHDGRWEEGLRTAQRLVILGRYDEADDYVRRFEPRGPHPGATHYGAAMQLLVQKQPQRALVHLTKARELAPQQPHIDAAYRQAMTQQGADRIASLVEGQQFDAAIAAIRALSDPPETDPEPWLRLGRLASRAKAPELAERYFRRAVQIRPEQATARQQLGLNLVVLGRCPDATRELAEAVRLDPRDAHALAHLAYCELQAGRVADARAHTEAALVVSPDNPLANQLRALMAR